MALFDGNDYALGQPPRIVRRRNSRLFLSEGATMGFWDRFRKPKPSVSLPQLCYDVAYFILPHYAFQDLAKLTDLCVNSPAAAGPFFLVMAAKARQMEPDIEDAKQLRWHLGNFGEEVKYFALEYPKPPVVDLSGTDPVALAASGNKIVLAPHFSLILVDKNSVQYFILGQAPIGGGTTLRCVTPDGRNCNLGSGPEPVLERFLDSVRERVAKFPA
jgi:hypothetical protein